MPDIIREILDDLYIIAPELRTKEFELVPLIQKLLAAKPEAQIDSAFRQRLRDHILAVASEQPKNISLVTNFFSMRKLSYALMGVFVLAIAGVGTFAYLHRPVKDGPVVTDTATAARLSITNRDASAFGAFSSNPAASSPSVGEAVGLGGGAQTKATSSVSSPAIGMPAPTVYEYVYKGESITIPDLPVLKRANQLPTTTLQSVLQSANLGLVDLNKFTNLKLQQVSLAEDIDQGYSISIDLNAGNIGIYQNWERWATAMQEVARNVNGVTQTPLPADEQLIALANAFLDKYGIPRSAYGDPVVPKYFMGYGNYALKVASQYIQSLQVVYPLIINGKPVVSENGYPMGLTVGIELNLNKVASVSNLTSLSYEASAYPLVSDTAQILNVVKRGGIYGSTINDSTVKKVQVEVGSPTIGYFPSQYQIDQTPTEYLIPALVFPITKAPQGEELYRTAIVVPLVKDVLEPQLRDMPVSTGGTGASSTTTNIAPDAQ